jgi:hypothetical protein
LLDGLRAIDRPELPVAPPMSELDSILKAGKKR